MQANERTFGIEIETHIPSQHASLFPVGGYHAGVQIPHYPKGWTGQADSSLGRVDGMHTLEIVSPILRGEDGLTQVVYVVNDLAELGAAPDEHCGLHVHIGVEDLTLAQVRAVKRAFIRYERAFYGLSGTKAAHRSSSRYCKITDDWHSDVDDRYRSLNLRNTLLARQGVGRKNTVEFRMWASTTVDTTVVAAISMAMALICKVVAFGAATHPRIESETESVKTFVHEHFRTNVCKIVADGPIADIVLHTWHEARQASH
jgi:hypothetical protein